MQRGLFQCWRDTPEPIHTLPHFGSTEGGDDDDADGDDGKKERMLVMLAAKYRPVYVVPLASVILFCLLFLNKAYPQYHHHRNSLSFK